MHDEHRAWFQEKSDSPEFELFRERPVAYFCAEYALSQEMPTYSGGLGILAGDVVREAADGGLPLIAVGLFYYEGYVCTVDAESKTCRRTHPAEVGFTPVTNEHGERIMISVPILDHAVFAQAWVKRVGSVPVYLLDADISENAATDRAITDRLYVSNKEVRIKQEILLGIGGLRLLEALQIHPSIYHLNEGHSAFLVFELIRHEMKERGLSFDEAKQFARRRTVFINHTLLPAGNDIFSNDLVSVMLAKYAEETQVPVTELIALGLVQESSSFSLTMLSLRMAGIVGAVSKLHARKAKEIWTDHPMIAVTNGVHLPTWDAAAGDLSAPGAFWRAHQARKRDLLQYIEQETGISWGEDELLVGWARRFIPYKRPLAIVDDLKRFLDIASRAGRPVRVVYAGIPHPDDAEGVAVLQTLKALIAGELAGMVVYLERYGLDVAKRMVAGTDIWLNTPIVGFEACGTSGMKAALNGSLPWSTKDGWVDEVNLQDAGWVIDSNAVTKNILDILEQDIVPMYYDRGVGGIPARWEAQMRKSREMIQQRFSAARMLREYVETLYI